MFPARAGLRRTVHHEIARSFRAHRPTASLKRLRVASRGASAQHDPWRAAPVAWRAGRNDDGLLGALQPVDLLFEFGDSLFALR